MDAGWGAEQPCLAPKRVVLTSGAGGADGLAPSHPLRHRPDHKESRRKGEKQTNKQQTRKRPTRKPRREAPQRLGSKGPAGQGTVQTPGGFRAAGGRVTTRSVCLPNSPRPAKD